MLNVTMLYVGYHNFTIFMFYNYIVKFCVLDGCCIVLLGV